METIFYTAIGIILGGIITFLVSKYYYKKSIKVKSLTPFIQFISEILTGIDEEVKSKLEIKYENANVTDLYQLQFVIANTGDLPVRDCIQPLSLSIPENGEILDINILHIEPKGRKVTYEIIRQENGLNKALFLFSLLNSSEYFIVKMLIKGELPSPPEEPNSNDENSSSLIAQSFDVIDHFPFNITADDLPPTIPSRRLPNQYESVDKPKKFDWSAVWGGGIIMTIGFCVAYLLITLITFNPNYNIISFAKFFTNISFVHFCILIGWSLALILFLVGFFIMMSEIMDLRPQQKPKFTIPSNLVRKHNSFFRYY